MDANLQTKLNFVIFLMTFLLILQMAKRVYLSAVTCLFKLINPLCGLDSHLEETQDPSHNVDNSVRYLSRGADVTNVSTGIVKHEGFHELGSNTLGKLW